MTNTEAVNLVETSEIPTITKEYKVPGIYSFLKVIESLLLAASVCTAMLYYLFPENQKLAIYGAGLISGFVFIFLINKQLLSNFKISEWESDMLTKSAIQNFMLETHESSSKNMVSVARSRALKYCQELISEYKRTRKNSRNIYYSSQISTIILSGITPILVLVERLDPGPAWFKWLPVLFPAIAAIIASVVTSFPFQEKWIAANKTVELLEAEQEKFVLGISPAYRCYDISDTNQRQNRAKKAIENFITQVNNIHLKQIQELPGEKLEADKVEENESVNSSKTPNASIS